jgi:hypothetical protein
VSDPGPELLDAEERADVGKRVGAIGVEVLPPVPQDHGREIRHRELTLPSHYGTH